MVTVTATGAYVRRCMAAAGLSAAELATVNYVAGSARRFASAMVTVADHARAEALAGEMNGRLVAAGSLGVASSSPAIPAAERGTRVLVRPPFARSTANGSWCSSMEGVATETWPVHLLRLLVGDRVASAAGAAIAFGRSDAPWLAVFIPPGRYGAALQWCGARGVQVAPHGTPDSMRHLLVEECVDPGLMGTILAAAKGAAEAQGGVGGWEPVATPVMEGGVAWLRIDGHGCTSMISLLLW